MFITITGIVLLFIVLIIRLLLTRREAVSAGLFYAALKNENNGNFDEAITNYEIALTGIKETRSNKNFRLKIIEKIKVLHTVIQYQKNLFILNKNAY